MPPTSPEAIDRHAHASRPSAIRSLPIVGYARPFGERAQKVIDLLAAGASRLEAARAVKLDKANVRVIELRARRRGLLGSAPRVAVGAGPSPFSPLAGPCLVRLPSRESIADRVAAELRTDPTRTNLEIAEVVGCAESTVYVHRKLLGVAPNRRGPREGDKGDRKPSRTALIRLARAAGRSMDDIGREHGISRERVRQILAREP